MRRSWLDSLADAAGKATPGWAVVSEHAQGKSEYWGYWHRVGELLFTGPHPHGSDEAFVIAATPERIKGLLGVANASMNWRAHTLSCSAKGAVCVTCLFLQDALRAALDRLPPEEPNR